jgi:hypothetical protein
MIIDQKERVFFLEYKEKRVECASPYLLQSLKMVKGKKKKKKNQQIWVGGEEKALSPRIMCTFHHSTDHPSPITFFFFLVPFKRKFFPRALLIPFLL